MLAEIEIKGRSPDCIRVVQITDTHIFASSDDLFDGVDTSASLAAVIQHIKQQEELPDVVLVSGDLVHDPVSAAYLKLQQQLLGLDVPMFCIPGNHDDPDLMHSSLNLNNLHTNKIIKAGAWGVILLNTHLAGSHAGSLKSEELDFLEQSLKRFRKKFILVCLHHPPVSIASPWMDAMMLENPEDLFSVIDNHKQVRSIIWGHIHQEFRTKRRDVILYGSPSTCIQFKPGSETYARDELGPGYSVLRLYEDGRVEIDTQRI